MVADNPSVTTSTERVIGRKPFAAKRAMDLVIAILFGLFVLSWLFPIILLLQKIYNPGPLFFHSRRIGLHKKTFLIHKLRSMGSPTLDVDSQRRFGPTSRNDQRITRFGRVLRQTSMDEIPQLYNVLKGEMSIVGPRPLEVDEESRIQPYIDGYAVRYSVKPGMTGWAQINGYRGGTTDIELMRKRIELDNWYVHNRTVLLDFRIALITLLKFVRGDPNAY